MSTPPITPAAPPQLQNPPPSQAEVEYRELREFLERLVKWASIAISTIVIVAGALLFNSVSDARKDAKEAIQATQESASREIAQIGRAAQATATAEAQKAIGAAFEKQNVQQLIERTAKMKVDTAVEAAVEKNLGARIEAFRTLINEIGEISNHGAQLRLGYRAGLDYLLQKRNSSDPTVRAYASSTIKLIASDYETAETILRPGWDNNPNQFFYPAASSPKQLMATIRNPPE